MVCADSSKEKRRVVDSMAMGLERSKPLHNFTLPFLKWGNQRYLRCMKLDSDGGDVPPHADRRSPAVKFNCSKFQRRDSETERPVFFKDSGKRLRGSKSKIERSHDNYEGDEGIAAVREKLMIDLKTAADKMKVAFWRDGVVEGEDDDDDMTKTEKELPAAAASASASAEELRPWNLRVRRAASKAPIDASAGGKGGSKALKIEKTPNRNSPLRSGDGGARSPGRRVGTEKKEREKFSVSLSKKEIEEDFMVMMGRRPPRRPKKRPRIVQNHMDVGVLLLLCDLFFTFFETGFSTLYPFSIADAFPRAVVDGDHRRSLRRAGNPPKRKEVVTEPNRRPP